MKRVASTGFGLGLLIISILIFLHYQKHTSDAAIRQKLPGIWVTQDGSSTCTRDEDGRFIVQLAGRHIGRLEGTWQVQDGFLIDSITNSSLTTRVPYIIRARILRMDGHELAVQDDASTISVSQRIEP